MTTESDTALAGAAYELASAGYVSMPDPQENDDAETIAGDSASLRDAAAQRGQAQNDVVARGYIDLDGKPVAANEAVTLARASRDYASATAAERLIAETSTSEALAARVDALRAEALADDPDAADFYGFDPPQAKVDEAAPANAAAEKPASEASGVGAEASLDPELEKALQHPQVRHATGLRPRRRLRRSAFSASFQNWPASRRKTCRACSSSYRDRIRRSLNGFGRWWRRPSSCSSTNA
jgi:hypothetical protein